MNSITIKGQRYKIKYVDTLQDDYGIYVGSCDKKRKVISILKGQTEKETALAILHEVGHAIIHETGIDQALPDHLEEIIVENFSTAYYKIFFTKGRKRRKKRKKSDNSM